MAKVPFPCCCSQGCADYGETWYLKFCDHTGTCEIFDDLVGTEVSFTIASDGATSTQLVNLAGLLGCNGQFGESQISLVITVSENAGTGNREITVEVKTPGGTLMTSATHIGTGCDIFDERFELTPVGSISGEVLAVQVSKSSAIICQSPPPPI